MHCSGGKSAKVFTFKSFCVTQNMKQTKLHYDVFVNSKIISYEKITILCTCYLLPRAFCTFAGSYLFSHPGLYLRTAVCTVCIRLKHFEKFAQNRCVQNISSKDKHLPHIEAHCNALKTKAWIHRNRNLSASLNSVAYHNPRNLWPLRHLIRVRRKHDMNNILTILTIFDSFGNFDNFWQFLTVLTILQIVNFV